MSKKNDDWKSKYKKIEIPQVDKTFEDVKTLTPHGFNPGAAFIKTPQIILTGPAHDKISCFISMGTAEVSWLGVVKRVKHIYIIEDVFLFNQKVSAAETEMSTEGIGQVAQEVMDKPGGVDLISRLQYWGHLHTHGSFDPSTQDVGQMEEFRNTEYPFFIRSISTKDGRTKFDIYVYEYNLIFKDVPWRIGRFIKESLFDDIKKEFIKKVRYEVYSYTGYNGQWWDDEGWKNNYQSSTSNSQEANKQRALLLPDKSHSVKHPVVVIDDDELSEV